ncbi:peptide MFS transporter [Luteibaculum oceani]|uniref:Peptide MFS transporter n=1 Tax=Luteibaculum oceani TaxID=1294296 RepID=A0A5C6VCX9_9FLAO|nr:peptide MFS transporter [Luteibaculum oceani]TXC81455.1 peptide MFS transporter [Luteibaculum oceani]
MNNLRFGGSDVNQKLVLGHPSGLFILFFTEMWERFSYYGMRALFVLFLTSSLLDGGWGWPREHALALYGTYTSLVYLTPILGGFIADRFTGYKWAVIAGAIIMTAGHASMAIEIHPFFMYMGLFLLVAGNGFFKPNMTSIISEMYKDHEDKKDGAFTIYYMGVNAGAFLGIMLCGYIGEKVGWSWGFGLAGIFMFFGMLQFYLAQSIFGEIGNKPLKTKSSEVKVPEGDKLNPFTKLDLIFVAVCSLIGLVWIIDDPVSTISGFTIFNFEFAGYPGATVAIVLAVLLFFVLVVSRIIRYTPKVRDRMIAVAIFSFFTVFFWAAFEQAGGSMTIFARDYTNRLLTGNGAVIFDVFNTLLTVVPLGIITWVIAKLFQQTYGAYKGASAALATSFIIIWGIVIWMLVKELSNPETEVAASWFGILNSFFIISFAPLFSKIWESKYNPSASVKYALGLILLGIGFGALAFGASGIPTGAQTASVSMIWLILAYLFHTLGELCLSPVGLSYLSKLVPARMIGLMFGVYYLAIAIGNKVAGTMGSKIDALTEEYSLSFFFLIFLIVPAAGGVLMIILNPVMKKLMHGVR